MLEEYWWEQINFHKECARTMEEALDFSQSKLTMRDLLIFASLIIGREEKTFEVDKLLNKLEQATTFTREEMEELLERLKKLGELYDPSLGTAAEGRQLALTEETDEFSLTSHDYYYISQQTSDPQEQEIILELMTELGLLGFDLLPVWDFFKNNPERTYKEYGVVDALLEGVKGAHDVLLLADLTEGWTLEKIDKLRNRIADTITGELLTQCYIKKSMKFRVIQSRGGEDAKQERN